jgi:hypothetical protein
MFYVKNLGICRVFVTKEEVKGSKILKKSRHILYGRSLNYIDPEKCEKSGIQISLDITQWTTPQFNGKNMQPQKHNENAKSSKAQPKVFHQKFK